MRDYYAPFKGTDFVVMGDGWRVRRLGTDGSQRLDGSLIFWYQAEWDCHPGVSTRTSDWQEAERWARHHVEHPERVHVLLPD